MVFTPFASSPNVALRVTGTPGLTVSPVPAESWENEQAGERRRKERKMNDK